jgi:serine/threonine protein kinase
MRAFGTVWKALDRENNEIVAMKEVVVDMEADLEEHLVEIEHMSHLSDPSIVNYKRSYLLKRRPSGYILWV